MTTSELESEFSGEEKEEDGIYGDGERSKEEEEGEEGEEEEAPPLCAFFATKELMV